jgi:hypothetical protein
MLLLKYAKQTAEIVLNLLKHPRVSSEQLGKVDIGQYKKSQKKLSHKIVSKAAKNLKIKK